MRLRGEGGVVMACSVSKALIEKTVDFHGHSCPGLMIGIRASELALERFAEVRSEDLVAVVETDMCAVDAIQCLTGCTFGKGNLIHRDYGKIAFSFYDRSQGKGFRALLRPDVFEEVRSDLAGLMRKAEEGTASQEEKRRIEELRERLTESYLEADLDQMFIVTGPAFPVPRPVRILASLRCESCGEMVMESRTRRFGGKTLCVPCFEKVDQKV